MQNQPTEAEQIELTLEQLEKKKKLGAALARLDQNADFQMIISEGFLKSYAINQVMLKQTPGLQDERTQKMLDNGITACGVLKQYFIAIEAEGREAISAIEEYEAVRAEMAREEAEASE